MMNDARRVLSTVLRGGALAWLALLGTSAPTSAQTPPPRLDDTCIVSVLNRNVRVRPDGTWVLPNIPANFGLVRARATCVRDGQTISGESAPFLITPNGSVDVPPIVLGPTTPVPQSVTVTSPAPQLGQVGQTVQLIVTARYADGSVRNIAPASAGTRYVVSNPDIATVSVDGLVTGRRSGTALVQATNEGTAGFTSVRVVLSADSDRDGIADDLELALGLDPNDPADALEDRDGDGLNNLDETIAGTNLNLPDSDSDGLLDGEEVRPGADGYITNPLSADTDGDGIRDALEVSSGSDPTDATSTNLTRALTSITVAPTTFSIIVNSVVGTAFQQLSVVGQLRDGTSINLTSTTRGTNYASSNLDACTFGAPDGRVFGAGDGTCVITVTNSGFSAQANGTVTNFEPTALSSLAIPGYANNVDANGSFAYVAAGSAGLVVVNVANPRVPVIVTTVDTPGNANDVRAIGSRVYVADGSAGLLVFDVTTPAQPALLGSFDTPGDASDVIVSGAFAYVADGTGGVHIVDVSTSVPRLVRTIAIQGTVRGVDIDGTTLVAVGDPTRLSVIDVTTPTSASVVGSLTVAGEPIDVDVSEGYAYVAAYTGGVAVVDVRTPSSPALAATIPGSSPNGFVPRDVQVAGRFALFAEQLFANAVAPIVDISNPTQPFFRSVLDFGEDYAGTGIAVSGPHVFWTGQSFFVGSENGSSGTTRLFIGQYIAIEDRNGIAPTISITAPAPGTSAVEGSSLTVKADANDDVGVAGVSFTVNGATVFTDTSEPYEARLTVPPAPGSMVLGATVTDFGGNSGTAATVEVTVIPDPLTTVTGRVVDGEGAPLAGATVTVLSRETTTDANGAFAIAGVSTVQGAITARVTAQVGGRTVRGSSSAVPPVLGGTTDVGTIRIKGGRILLVWADTTPETFKANLLATGMFTADDIDTFDGRSATPTLAQLQPYGAVLVWSNYPYQNPTLLGNVLADYVDGGGGLVTATFSHLSGFALAGRIVTGGYTALRQGGSVGANEISLVNSDLQHPIMQGVAGSLTFSFTDYGGLTVAPGAIVVARDTVNQGKVAVNPNARVVSIGVFPGFGVTPGLARMFGNALDFVR
ncbi:Ig-like domain-containing protein [Luteitalea sp.]|jgi:hypothetical protein|uniref:Ig-like domain-containing protein n=1 Tax=Luteitalea sp. TaxID=2004800 RepID=UPI0037CACC9B